MAEDVTRADIFREVARNLRDQGQSEASAQQVADTYNAIRSGGAIPHGYIGRLAEGHLRPMLETLAELARGE